MLKLTVTKIVCTTTAAFILSGCQDLPGTRTQQGTVIGGAAGAATGAILAGSGNRGIGALLGGLLGAGGGYVIAAKSDKIKDQDTGAARTAMENAQQNPATAQAARTATSADLNGDGFVTLDEVVALKGAGFSEERMLDMMQSTGQVFELTPEQRNYLLNHGVSRTVVDRMAQLNQAAGSSSQPSGVISREPDFK
jgi:hypothetical protein